MEYFQGASASRIVRLAVRVVQRSLSGAALCMCVMLLAAASATAASNNAQYTYDSLGRVIQALNSDGTGVQYQYDSNGNVTLISRINATTPSVSSFTPTSARAGTSVTVVGSGFSLTPANNVVSIGSVPVVVSAATATSLVFTIPIGAVTNPISVSVGGVSANSPQSLVVLNPAITGFSPAWANTGASVTLQGSNLNLTAGTTLAVGGTPVSVSSLTSTQAVFAAPSAAGLVTVNTSYGTATSATPLVIVPNGVNAANVTSITTFAVGGPSQTLSINQANKYALMAFSATPGQSVSVQVASVTTTPANASVSFTVYSPANTAIITGSVVPSIMTIHLPPITTAGVYSIAFWSGGSSSVQISASIELDTTLSASGMALGVSTSVVGQSKRLVFAGTAGQSLGLALTNLAFTPTSVTSVQVYIDKPDGTNWSTSNCYTSSLPGCQFSLRNLPATGNYAIRFIPYGAAAMSFSATLSQDVSGALSLGVPLNLDLAVPGQNALLTFTATAGQTVALNMSSIVTNPASKTMYVYVYNASGTQVASINGTSAASATANLPNLAAGTYSVLAAPQSAATATLQMTLVNGLTATLPVDGSTSFALTTSVQGQYGYFTFAGTAGQNLGLGITNLVLTPSSVTSANVFVDKPNGSNWQSGNCYPSNVPGCQISLSNLPVTGSYTVRVVPGGQATMSVNLTLSQDVSGALTMGTPANVNLAVPGQNALLTFTTTAVQTVALTLSAVATTPAGKMVYAYVYNASGTYIGSTNTTSGITVNLTNLAAGTYSVLIAPQLAATATLQVKVQ